MKSYLLALSAEEDLFNIWTRIAPENLNAADELESEFFKTFQRIAQRSDLGHFRRDLTDKPVRFFNVRRKYLIVYDPARDPLIIVRVLHGARDVTL